MKAMLAERWDGESEISGWWMSEKLDGVRAVWDGERLMSRTGKRLNAPEWFVAGLPAGVWLDGELWLGRGRFQELAGVLRKKGSGWEGVLFMVFDAPGNDCFEQRLERLQGLELPEHVRTVDHIAVRDVDHCESLFADVLKSGGEGLMLRELESYYIFGRSQRLLKMKLWQSSEAVVEQRGAGAVICAWQGKRIKVQTFGRESGLQVGDLITFDYSGVTLAGKPRHTKLITVRDYE